MKKNGTDIAADAIRAACEGHPPDYTAPALTSQLVKAARKIGLSKETVLEQIDRMWQLHEDFGV